MTQFLGVVLLAAVALLVSLPNIHRWEREAGYPYGKLCEVYRSCPVDVSR